MRRTNEVIKIHMTYDGLYCGAKCRRKVIICIFFSIFDNSVLCGVFAQVHIFVQNPLKSRQILALITYQELRGF